MRTMIGVLLVVLCQGCAIGFRGDRAIKCNLNILGNTVEWESAVTGAYTPAPTPERGSSETSVP